MAFLNPLVLIGLAAAAIPILIHLFNFRRPQRVDFPSLRFVRELERKAMRRVRLRQWLLLALRTLAVLALVLAFARPTLPSAWREAFGARPPAAVALVVDNSMSMMSRDERGAYFDQARATAAAIAEAAPAGDALVLVPTAAGAGAAPRLAPTAAPALDALESLAPAHGSDALAAAAARAASVIENADQPRREIYLVSDLQASTLVDSAVAALPEDVRITLVRVGGGTRVNTAVTGVRVENRLVEPGRPVRLTVTVARHGAEAGPVTVRVILQGEAVAEGSVNVEPGTPATIGFSVPPPRAGWVSGEARLAEGDAFASDDARDFTLQAPPARRVLLVRGEGRGAEFVRLALGLGAESGAVVANEVSDASIPVTLDAYDVIVLMGPRRLSPGLVAALRDFVGAGGGVLLSPAANADASSYDALFRSLGGGRINGYIGSPGGASMGALGDVDMQHPLLAGLMVDGGRGRVEGPEVAYAARYVPGGGDETTIARLAAGAPFLHEIRRGRGALLFLSVAPDPTWSDLPGRALFAPLILRSVAYLAGAGAADAGAGDALIAGRPATLRLDGVDPAVPVRFVAADGVVVPSEQRAVPGAVMLDVDSPAITGVYRVMQGDEVIRLVAVQPDPVESDLRTVAPEEAVRQLAALTGRDVTLLDARGDAGAAALQRRGRGAPLWTVFLVTALLALVAETIVATRWRPESVPA